MVLEQNVSLNSTVLEQSIKNYIYKIKNAP